MSVINFERLDAAITWGFEHPDEFYMGSWYERTACGTTACLAGTAAAQAGWEPKFNAVGIAEYVVRDGVVRAVWAVAREYLGLTEDQASVMFFATNIHGVLAERNRLAVAAGVPWRYWEGS